MLKRLLAIPLLTVFWTAVLLGADGDKVFFSRNFPESVPEYFDVTVHTDGKVIYREALDDELPNSTSARRPCRSFGARPRRSTPSAKRSRASARSPSPATRSFGSPTTPETGARPSSCIRTIQTDKELVSWFVRVAETEWHRINIERAIQFDRLGVNKAILQFHSSFDRERVVAPGSSCRS